MNKSVYENCIPKRIMVSLEKESPKSRITRIPLLLIGIFHRCTKEKFLLFVFRTFRKNEDCLIWHTCWRGRIDLQIERERDQFPRIGNGSKLWPICHIGIARASSTTNAKNLSTTEKATHAVLLLQSGSLVSERRSCCCKGANVIAAESCGVTKLRWVWRHSVHRCADHLKISSLANIASFFSGSRKIATTYPLVNSLPAGDATDLTTRHVRRVI